MFAPKNRSASLGDKIVVWPAHALRLSTQARIAVSGKRMREMFHRLAEWRAAMASPINTRANIKMCVEVDDSDRKVCTDITQVVAIRSLVSSAKDDRDSAGLENVCDDLSQVALRILHGPLDTNVAYV